MKKGLSLLVLMLMVVAGAISLGAQEKSKTKKAKALWHDNRDHEKSRSSPNAMVGQQIGSLQVSVTYGRPGVKGRKIFGGLLPFGKVWRTGADEATTIRFSRDVQFGGQKVQSGTYGLFTIPGENSWTVILNKVADQWGSYEYDAGKDAARVEVEAGKVDNEERLTIEFANLDTDAGSADLVIRWATTEVAVPLK